MSRTIDLLGTMTAGAAGALLAATTLGASLLLVLPSALGVGAVAILGRRANDLRPRRSPVRPM